MNMKTMTYVLALIVVGFAGAASAQVQRTANGPICDTAAKVGSTTFYSCGSSSHNALDMSNGTCNTYFHRGMLVGTFSYTYFGGCGQSCTSCSSSCCNGGAGNYIRVAGSGGWDFRQLHINHHSTESVSKSCDRCAFGLVGSTGHSTGAHVHAENRKDGVRTTAWYTNVGTTCGSSANCTSRVGVPTL